MIFPYTGEIVTRRKAASHGQADGVGRRLPIFQRKTQKVEDTMEKKQAGQRLNQYVTDYIVFDLETTGLSPVTDQIIELSALKVKQGKVTDTFSTLVNPGRHIPYGATAVNGITDSMVKDAPPVEQVVAQFLDFAGDQVLVGHNIHSFDMKFLYTAAEALGRQVTNSYVDTLYLARRCLPQLSHHRLVDLAGHFHISTEGAHRALNDCLMNQKCYEAMAKLQKEKKIPPELVCPRCKGELVKREGRYGSFYGCSNFPGCRYTRNA